MRELGNVSGRYDREPLKLGKPKVLAYLKQESALEPLRVSMLNTLRQAQHILRKEVKTVMAKTRLMSSASASTYDVLAGANLPWTEIKLLDGDKKIVTRADSSRLRSIEDRGLRATVFNKFWKLEGLSDDLSRYF